MGYKITIEWDGLESAIQHFSGMQEQALQNVEDQLVELARAGQDAWRSATPVRTGRLMGGDRASPGGLEVDFYNAVFYYKFVDEPGHNTPSHFKRHGRIVPAKRRSHVAGKPLTKTLVEFLEGAVGEYLQKALDDLGS